MSATVVFFLLAAATIVCLLVWALRPAKTVRQPADEVLEALSLSRHRSQLPQIMRALQKEDLQFLQGAGAPELAAQVRSERREAALEYLDNLAAEYELVVEAMRILAAMSSELIVLEEWQRFKALAGFAITCQLLRWKLLAGFTPRESFQLLSEVVSSGALKVERATSMIGEKALLTVESTGQLEHRGGSGE